MRPPSSSDDTSQPTPRDYVGVHRVAAICRRCDRVVDLDLDALIAAGHGDTPLVKLPLRCAACGSRYHQISIGGRPR